MRCCFVVDSIPDKSTVSVSFGLKLNLETKSADTKLFCAPKSKSMLASHISLPILTGTMAVAKRMPCLVAGAARTSASVACVTFVVTSDLGIDCFIGVGVDATSEVVSGTIASTDGSTGSGGNLTATEGFDGEVTFRFVILTCVAAASWIWLEFVFGALSVLKQSEV